jgi:hypothetical protein
MLAQIGAPEYSYNYVDPAESKDLGGLFRQVPASSEDFGDLVRRTVRRKYLSSIIA